MNNIKKAITESFRDLSGDRKQHDSPTIVASACFTAPTQHCAPG
ncbi:hypothetical protein [Rhodococcus sp. NPDC057529]